MSVHTDSYPAYSATEAAFQYLAECLLLDFKIAEAAGKQIDFVQYIAGSLATCWMAGAQAVLSVNEMDANNSEDVDLDQVTDSLREVHLRCTHQKPTDRATGYVAILDNARIAALDLLANTAPSERPERLQILVQGLLNQRAQARAQQTARGGL